MKTVLISTNNKKLLPTTALLLMTFLILGNCASEKSNNYGNSAQTVAETENTEPLKVDTYTSPPGDAVNTHWIETASGIIVVDAQRLLPEAEKALAEIKKSGKPIIGIFITHPHTDHYGGLRVFAESLAPDTPIFAHAKTIESMKNDNRDFNEARRKKHGEEFPTQEQINKFLPNRLINDGESVELGGLKFEIIAKPTNESEMSTLLYLPEYEVLFTGDLVNNKVTPAPFESVEKWIEQLTEISQKLPNLKTLYLGHGEAGTAQPLIAEQLEYLKLLRDSVKEELKKNGQITPTGREEIIKKN